MRPTKSIVSAALALGVTALSAASASADTFAVFSPVDTGSNVSLSGLTLSASAPVIFDFNTPGLPAFGDLSANWTMNATETGAIAFGPISLASFDGTFSFLYAGPLKTVGGVTLHPGDNLLSATFLGSVLNGYGSAGSIDDSVAGGGLVSYSSSFLTFDPIGDQAMSLGLASVDPVFMVVSGQLSPFSGSASGNFAADITSHVTGGGVPEPATWSMLLVGFAGLGAALRSGRRRRAALAI